MQQVQPTEMDYRNGTPLNGLNATNHLVPALTQMMPMPAPGAAEDEGGVDLHAIWNAFRRCWFLALSLGLILGVPAAIGMWMVAPSPYVAFAELRLNSINTEQFPGSKGGAVPNFNIWKQAVLKRAKHPIVLNEALRVPEVQSSRLIREQEPHVTQWLEEELKVQTVGTEYFRLQLEGEYPKELAKVLNVISGALIDDIDHDLYLKRTNRKKSLDTLLTEATNSINTKNNELENMRKNLKVDPAQIQRRQSYLIELASRLQSALVDIDFKKVMSLAARQGLPETTTPQQAQVDAQIEEFVDRDLRYLKALEDVSSQKSDIARQERYVANLAETVSETLPTRVEADAKLVKLEAELEEFKKAEQLVREDIKNEILATLPKGAGTPVDPQEWYEGYKKILEAAFAKNESKLNTQLEQIKIEQDQLERYSVSGDHITREIEREQARFERLQDEEEKLQFEIDNTPELIEISREATVPHERSLKKKTMLAGVSGFGVFGFFVAGIVFLEYRTQRIATINQVSDRLNLRVMGAVPMLPRSAASGNSAKKKAKNALWYSALTEAVDSTRTLLIRGSQIESLKTVMIASAVGGEGKTTMASHLATSLARGGRKILLVDCDLRRPCLHRAFDLPMTQGVCEVLRGEADVADCIYHLESPVGLDVLPAGKINQQVLKLLALDSLGEMLEPLKQQYDFIVIDTSPLLPVTDGLLVAQHVDGVILSIRRDVSRIGKVMMACQKLSMLGIPLLGAVTIGLHEERGSQSKYGYSYGYGSRPHYYTQLPSV